MLSLSLVGAMPLFKKYRERRNIREVAEKRIAEAGKQFANELADPKAFERGELQPYFESVEGPESIIEWLETAPLVQQAEKLGIEIPQEWWVTKKDKPWIEKWHLDAKHRAKLKRLINEARYTQAKKFVELVIPVLGLLVALVALLKDILIAWLD
ncbi:MAG: hypothetical protein A3H28_07530 [Acidobacteria bacterium RIFCSPLOWO2_02_FULL_61_28]|nr:MAG: hypothetical protein A3H28_07530 [Acidobacteria bacterium RIFCSPLOWO2_02_FULL_61_28]